MQAGAEDLGDIYPLTPLQSGILYHVLEATRRGTYIGQTICVMHGPIDRKAFSDAWAAVLQRHSVLRTAFVWDGLDEPLQVARPTAEMPLAWLKWTADTQIDDLDDPAFQDWLLADRLEGFALNEAPLMRVAIMSRSEVEHVMVWTAHHIILDGWSSGIVLEEVMKSYADDAPASGPGFAFRDYVAEVRSRSHEQAKAYWTRELADAQGRGLLQVPMTADPQTEAARSEVIATFGAASMASLIAMQRRERVTISTVLQYAWARVLAAYADMDHVVFGLIGADRPGTLAEIETGVGPMLRTVPVFVHLGSGTVREDLRCLEDATRARQPFETAPLAQIHAWAGQAPGNSLFETVLSIQPQASGILKSAMRGLSITSLTTSDQSHYPFSLIVSGSGALSLKLHYDPRRIDATVARGVLDSLITVLSALPESVGTPSRALQTVTSAEKRLIADFSDGGPYDAPFRAVHHMIADHGRDTPNRPALASGDVVVDYGTMSKRVEALAQELQARGVGKDRRVAILMDRTPDYVIGVLAVLASGAAYVPLDPDYPADRVDFILNDCRADLVLTTRGVIARGWAKWSSVACLFVEDVPAASSAKMVLPDMLPGDPAYIIYTSGSTGTPKGVIISHGNLASSTGARAGFYAAPPDPGFLLLSSFAFDSSVVGLYWTLTTGALLVLAPSDREHDMVALGQLIGRYKLSHLLCIPSLYALLLDGARTDDLASLRTAIVAGEPVSSDVTALHRAILPGARLVNEYGPTEATVWCTAQDITDHVGPGMPPIGKPIQGTQIHILDRNGNPTGLGTTGEIFVGGHGIAQGYVNRPEENSERFIPDHFADRTEHHRLLYRTGDLGRFREDGAIEFLGRSDRQIKLRGHRIEPNEIELAALAQAGVTEAVAVPFARPQTQFSDSDLAHRLFALHGPQSDAILDEIERNAHNGSTKPTSAP